MTIIDGPSGSPTIRVRVGNSAPKEKTYTNYGAAPPPPVIASSFTSKRSNVIDPGYSDEPIEVIQPAFGKLIPRKDGKITYDLNEVPYHTQSFDQTIQFIRKRNNVRETVQMTFLIKPPEQAAGWGPADFYRLETDPATDRMKWEPTAGTLYFYCAHDGMTAADVAAAQGGGLTAANITPTWLWDNIATGYSVRYGSCEALALHPDVFGGYFKFVRQSRLSQYQSSFVGVKRGGVYPGDFFGDYNDKYGDSRLHPIGFLPYGTGADPAYEGDGPGFRGSSHFGIRQDMVSHVGTFDTFNTSWQILDGITCIGSRGYGLDMSHANQVQRGKTIRRITVLDASLDSPTNEVWKNTTKDRVTGIYASSTIGLLMEKIFTDRNGWTEPYEVSGDPAYGKIPESYSHNFYIQTNNADLTADKVISLRACHSAAQFRPGAIVMNFFGAGGNTGTMNGRGPDDLRTNVSEYESGGHWSLIYNYYGTQGGFKDLWNQLPVVAGHYAMQSPNTGVLRMSILNAGNPAKIISTPTDLGPAARVASSYGMSSRFPYKEILGEETLAPYLSSHKQVAYSGWNEEDFPPAMLDGQDINAVISKAARDAITIQALTQQITGSPGGLDELAAFLRGVAAPWDYLGEILSFGIDPIWGALPVRTVAQTVTFRPLHDTPGWRADIPVDWDTGDFPGTVAGDSVDLDGHRVIYNVVQLNPLQNLTFGKGGELWVKGDKLKFDGQVNVHADGNRVAVTGGRFHTSAKSGGKLDMVLVDGRYVNHGTLDNANVWARYKSEAMLGYEGSTFTLGSGRELNVYGYSRVGFDGATGGAATINLQAGSITRFKPTMRMKVRDLHLIWDAKKDASGNTIVVFGPTDSNKILKDTIHPRNGSIVRGATSGATAIMRDWMNLLTYTGYLILDDVVGVFQLNEPLMFDDPIYGTFSFRKENLGTFGLTDYGKVDGIETALSPIAEYETGMTSALPNPTTGLFDNSPKVVSNLVRGGTLHVDVTGLANGTYPLIVADSVTGTWGGITAAGNAAKAITIASTSTGNTMTLADGSGQIN